MITEVLNSVDKIGIVKTSKLFNIYCSTIYSWLNHKKICIKEQKSTSKSESLNISKLVLRRVHLENGGIDCYIYNLKDLGSGLEFNSIAINPNYKTPVIFLKYILYAYLKETNINSFQILIKGSARVEHFDKFNNLIDNCKLELIKTEDRFNTDSFNKKRMAEIEDKNTLIEFLTDEQMYYNLKKPEDNNKNLRLLYPPIVLDSFSPKNEEVSTASTLERLISKTNLLLREAKYNLFLENIETIKAIVEKSTDQKLIIQYYELEIKYFARQGDYVKALDFLKNTIRKINNQFDEAKFIIILNICKIFIKNYNIKEFDYYFNKIDKVDFNKFSKDSIIEFHLLMFKRKSLYLPVEESVNSYIEILGKHKKYISQKKLFEIYGQISNLYLAFSKFKEAHEVIDKAKNLPDVQNDQYLLCEYHYLKCKCFKLQGLIDETQTHVNALEKIASEYGFKDYYYESKRFKAYILSTNDKFDLAKVECEKCLNYGMMTSNKLIIFNACVVISICYYRIGNLQKALKFNQKQIELSKSFMNLKHEIDVINNRCVYLSRSPNKNEMLQYVNKFEELNKILKDSGTEIRALSFKACYYQFKKENYLAFKFYKKALDSAKINKFINWIHTICSHIAIVKRD